MGADRHPPHPLILAGIPLALLLTWTAVADLLTSTPLRDFAAFHASGVACCDSTSSWYVAPQPDRPNLNPPTTTLVLFSWMAGWPLRSAAIAWTLVGVLTVGIVIWRIRGALTLTMWQTVAVAAALLASFPARVVWSQGQIVWILTLLVTEAWIAARGGRLRPAGAWLSIAIAIKPILALFPLALGWTILAVAAVGSIAITAGTVALTGTQPWLQWIALSTQVTWLAKPDNLSIAGVFARHGWPLWLAIVPLLACVAAGASAWRLTIDRRWVAGGLLTLLASPLGWAYYLPVFVGPLAAVALSRPPVVFWVGLAILFVPMSIWTPLSTAIPPAASIYTVGLVFMAAVVLLSREGLRRL